MRLRSGNGAIWFLVLGLLAAIVAGWWTWSAEQSAHRTENVVVATHDVAPLAAIAPGDVTMMPVPIEAVPTDAVSTRASVVGRYVRYGLLRGQVVRTANLATTQTGASQTDAQITSAAGGSLTMRAVAVALQADTGLDLPAPGDHVDVLAVVRGQGTTQARVIASHVLVLDRLATTAASNGPPGSAQPVLQQGALVLALTVAQAEQVALAQTVGQVQVLLDPLGTSAQASPPPPVDAGQWLAAGGK